MAAKLSDTQKKMLMDKNFASIATLNKDGSPQVTPVWVDYDGTHVLINTEDKRLKTRNMRRDARVSLSVQDMVNPYQYVEIRGRVVELTPEGGAAHIDKMAKKYMGQDKYPFTKPGDVRIIVKIEPDKISGQG